MPFGKQTKNIYYNNMKTQLLIAVTVFYTTKNYIFLLLLM